jgi:diguanylate cyclase (GGDEF)-like protein
MTKNILLEDANQKLNYLSSHDPLTGLSNRRNFEIHVKQKMRSINQYKDKASLVLIDVDHFKNINDKFGHPIGDIILKELSNILLENIKDTDLAARWGGEEFVILLPKTSIDEASILADKIRTAIEKKVITIDDFQIKITASFGVSQLKGNFSTSFDSSFKLADKALYEAKSRGRNCVVIASYIEEE